MFLAAFYFCRIYKHYQKQALVAINILSRFLDRTFISTCKKCALQTDNVALHTILFCSYNEQIRCNLWSRLLENLTLTEFNSFCSNSPEIQMLELLSGLQSLVIPDETRIIVFKNILNHLYKLWL